jgi:hypothetical protein
MPSRSIEIITIKESDAGVKLLLETLLMRIKDRIIYAKSLTKPMVVLQDGSTMDRLAWINEAETERALIEIELIRLS